VLTKQDLSQIKNILQTELKTELKPIKDKLLEHDKKFELIDTKFKKLNKKLDKFEKKNTEDHNIIIEYFESDIINNKKRLDRIDHHLGLPVFSTI